MARKLKYDDDFPLRAEDYARQGMIDKEIMKCLGVGKSAFYRYLLEIKEFRDAIKRGKAPVDVEVENALLKRAKGFEYEEVQIEFKPGKGEDDPIAKTIKKIKKLIIGDVTAQIFWLKNRRSKVWKDRHNFNVSGNMNIKVISAVPRPKRNNNKKNKNHLP